MKPNIRIRNGLNYFNNQYLSIFRYWTHIVKLFIWRYMIHELKIFERKGVIEYIEIKFIINLYCLLNLKSNTSYSILQIKPLLSKSNNSGSHIGLCLCNNLSLTFWYDLTTLGQIVQNWSGNQAEYRMYRFFMEKALPRPHSETACPTAYAIFLQVSKLMLAL